MSANTQPLPDPRVVLDRYVTASGLSQFDLSNFSEQAQVNYGMRANAIDHVDVTVQDGPGRNAHLPIGHYDPAAGLWRFPSECVQPEERGPLAEKAQQLYAYVGKELTPQVVRQGATVVDPQHTMTRAARQEIANVLTPLNPKEWLARDGVIEQLHHNGTELGKFVAADEFTINYATLHNVSGELTHSVPVGANDSMTHAHPLVIEDGILSLSYAGVLVETVGSPGHTLRSTRSLRLATIDPHNLEEWKPNLDAITLYEWELLRDLPDLILDYAQANRKFSPSHCARVRKVGFA